MAKPCGRRIPEQKHNDWCQHRKAKGKRRKVRVSFEYVESRSRECKDEPCGDKAAGEFSITCVVHDKSPRFVARTVTSLVNFRRSCDRLFPSWRSSCACVLSQAGSARLN